MLYKDWLNEWLGAYVRPAVKQRTAEKYIHICRVQLIPALGDHELHKLSPILLQKFVADLAARYASNTINVIISVLKSSLKRARSCGLLSRDISSGIVRPRTEEKQIICFTQDEQKKIENHISKSKKKKLVGILLCLYTGLRIGELLALTWKDIDYEREILSVTRSCHDSWGENGYQKILEPPKTSNSIRLIPIPKQLLGVLKKARSEVGGTYVVDGEKSVSVRSYQRTFELLQRKLQIPHKGFHALRHTFATRALECGIDVKTLSEILGHKNSNVTLNRYVHSLMDHKRSMMNRLGKLLQ